jgi:hypothetical protein
MYAALPSAKSHRGGSGFPPGKPWCGVCKLPFATPQKLQKHANDRRQTHSHCCQLCHRIFVDELALRSHVLNSKHHELRCNLDSCLGACFKTIDDWRAHLTDMRIHTWACAECLIAFETASGLSSHLESVHRPAATASGAAQVPLPQVPPPSGSTSNGALAEKKGKGKNVCPGISAVSGDKKCKVR